MDDDALPEPIQLPGEIAKAAADAQRLQRQLLADTEPIRAAAQASPDQLTVQPLPPSRYRTRKWSGTHCWFSLLYDFNETFPTWAASDRTELRAST
jgi:hypothetical protein